MRFAPSPTGVVHLGTARTALFNFLFAIKYGGKFILRIEDTDKERSKKEFEANIIESLTWLGFSHDEMYRQSERTEIYRKYLQSLIDKGHAYVSEEPTTDPGSDSLKRSQVIRFRNAGKTVTFKDEIRGNIEFNTHELGDFVIAKSLEEPLYHLAVVVDDYEMNITHVIRGEDHISNTPRQILIQEALGAPRPAYLHLPLILGKDRSKLSKRHGALPILDYRDKGYLPAAVSNYLAFLGWRPLIEQEIFTQKQLNDAFDVNGIQKSPAIFSDEKLDWTNRKHIALLSGSQFQKYAALYLPPHLNSESLDANRLKRSLPFIRERISKFGDLSLHYEEEFSFFFEISDYPVEKLISPVLRENSDKDTRSTLGYLVFIRDVLSRAILDNLRADKIKSLIWGFATENGRGSVLWPMRYALSGKDKSPDPFSLVEVLGKEESLRRLSTAIEKIQIFLNQRNRVGRG